MLFCIVLSLLSGGVVADEWYLVEGDVGVDCELEKTPIYIHTDEERRTGTHAYFQIAVAVFTPEYAGELKIRWKGDTGEVSLGYACGTHHIQGLPSDTEKYWKIDKTKNRMIIDVNDVEVLLVKYTDISGSCEEEWKTPTTRLMFDVLDDNVSRHVGIKDGHTCWESRPHIKFKGRMGIKMEDQWATKEECEQNDLCDGVSCNHWGKCEMREDTEDELKRGHWWDSYLYVCKRV